MSFFLCKRSSTCANCKGYVATVATIFDIAPRTNASAAVNDDDDDNDTTSAVAEIAFRLVCVPVDKMLILLAHFQWIHLVLLM